MKLVYHDMDLCFLMFVLTLGEILGVFMTIEKFSELMENFFQNLRKDLTFFEMERKTWQGGVLFSDFERKFFH